MAAKEMPENGFKSILRSYLEETRISLNHLHGNRLSLFTDLEKK